MTCKNYTDECEECEDGTFEIGCSTCNGSGEGMYDGFTCHACKGKGVVLMECNEYEGEE